MYVFTWEKRYFSKIIRARWKKGIVRLEVNFLQYLCLRLLGHHSWILLHLFFRSRPSPGLLPVLGPLGGGTDTTHQPSPALRLLVCWWSPVECQVVKYCKGIAAPGALQFELGQSVSTSEQSIYHTQARFKPTEAEWRLLSVHASTSKQRYWKRLFRFANFGRFRDVSGYP